MVKPEFTEGFQKVAQAMAEGQKQEGIKTWHARFGSDFLDARNRQAAINQGWHFGRLAWKRQQSARAILAADPTTV